MHNNTSSNTSVRGCTAIYPQNHDTTNSYWLGKRIVSSISSITSLPLHREPYQGDFQVLRDTQMPAKLYA
ncbi:N-acetylmuramoyl-L-alanine amidase [Thermincola ferriacetica]|uniref:N-acetylmuramoyl-L-alanine amidase n=1 Tax=Thermincola ferriacetica TaxID=281456 RepID=UPI003D010F43